MYDRVSREGIGAKRLAVLCGALALGLAATTANAASSPPDFTGFWFHQFDPATDVRTERGNFTEGYVPPPKLVAGLHLETEDELSDSKKFARAVVDGPSAWCMAKGYPWYMRVAVGFSIVQGKKQILTSADFPMNVHQIRLDRKTHPEGWRPSLMGDSIGHWEGDVLVVETIGMREGRIPGALGVTPTTKLVERFRKLSPDKIAVQFTWTDPAMFTEPHVYEFNYDRMPADTYEIEYWCDASDPAQHEEPYEDPK